MLYITACCGAPWIRASRMTGGPVGQPDQHRKGRLCSWQRCSPYAVRGLGDWALWFWGRECDTERWLLVAGSWDCDWRRCNGPWGSFPVLVYLSWQMTVARLHINGTVWPNGTSSRSSECWSRHQTPWKDLSGAGYDPARRSFCTASWTASKFQNLFPWLHFASSRVPFSGHWLWPSPFCLLARVRKHLRRCETDGRRPPCSSKLHHREIYMKHTYSSLTMPVCTQLHNWIWDAERGFHLVEIGLQLQAGTGSFPSSPSHSIEKLPHMMNLLVWGRGKEAWITRLHRACRAVRVSWWSGKSTSAGGQACRSALYRGGWGSGDCSRYREYIEECSITGGDGTTRVWHRVPWCWHRRAFYIGCDPAGGDACKKGHNLQVRCLDIHTRNRHATRDDVGCYTQGNMQAMLVKPVSNACRCHLHTGCWNTRSWRCDFV